MFSVSDKKPVILTFEFVMQANGWTIDVEKSSINGNDDERCGGETFYGYKKNAPVGAVRATFIGSGKAPLNFGNC